MYPRFSRPVFAGVIAALPIALSLLNTKTLTAAPPDPVPATPDPAGAAYFEKNIRPLLNVACLSCHNAAKGSMRGGLGLDTAAGWMRGGEHGPAIVPGKPDASRLMTAISYTNDDLQMPPSGKMPDDKIALIRDWIARGAPDTRIDAATGGASTSRLSGLTAKARAHWSFQPLVAPEVPHPKDPSHWIQNPIDAFVLANLRGHDMHPNARASREVLIRRAYYDMIGQPPTVGEVRAFLADRSTNAWQTVVDRLLASPHYGERWGRHWLDSARYSDASGDKNQKMEDYRYPYAWTYRDYVIKSFNEDKPYNQFLVEQIAADKLPDIQPNDPRLAALGFLTVGKRFDNPDDTIDERIDTVSKATMALTVSCARCHDHKFDPVPTADYYSLYGVFKSTNEPVDKPLLDGGYDATQQDDFNKKLAALVDENQRLYYAWAAKDGRLFRRGVEGYLLASAVPAKSPERYDILRKYGLPDDQRGPSREIFAATRLRAIDPVLGPFARLAHLPTKTFAKESVPTIAAFLNNRRNTINPLVRNALASLRPQSLVDVARAYAALFAKVEPLAGEHVQARQMGQPEPQDISPAQAQLLNTPFPLPAPAELATPEEQVAYFDHGYMENETKYTFVFPAINELRLTHPGAPGRAMIVADSDTPQNAAIHIRGDKNNLGKVVPREFLAVCSDGPQQPFVDGSGRLELAHEIASPKNPLTARTIVNRTWMYHFGDGFVRTADDLGNQSEAPSDQKLLDYLSVWFENNIWSMKKLHRLILMSNTYQESSADNPAYAIRDPEDRLMWRAEVRRLDFEAIRDSLVMLTGKLDPAIGGKPVNITDEPYTYRRSIYGYVDRGDLSDLMRQFDFSDPSMPNTDRTSTIVPQQALFFMNSPMSVDVARQLVARPEVTEASDTAARVTAIYLALFQRSPRPEEIQLAQKFVDQATALSPSDPTADARAHKQAQRRAQNRNAYQADRAAKNARAPIENAGLPVARTPLTPWELYAQALLCSNEFVYVD